MRRVYGRIRNIYIGSRLIEIKVKDRLEYFYLPRSLMKRFEPYLKVGLYICLQAVDVKKKHLILTAYEVIEIIKMSEVSYRHKTTYFDKETVKRGVTSVLNRPGYKMFLDFEFSMPPYDLKEPFVAEIIQYGLVIENEDGQVVDCDHGLVRPSTRFGVNRRTCNFLNLDRNDFKKAISFKQFYRKYKKVIKTYQPVIFVWGKADLKVLDDCYALHKVPSITPRSSYVNLMQLIKNYFGIKMDIGLFNACKLFDVENDDKQIHDALQDAYTTSVVYHLFKDYALKK